MPTDRHSGRYCRSRFRSFRRPTREVRIGEVGIGGGNPLRLQSMTTTDTRDVAATVRQTLALAEAGCEIVRITAPNRKAAEGLGDIARELRAAGCGVPLAADIHFLPAAAMEAAKHVEKVRINPGNYADQKKFAVHEYSEAQYQAELERLHEAFSPLVLRCRELGRAMRIGTNHGSLSDRIMNRYGDTPLGMVESALEFIRIAESHGYRDIVLSMKASNPKVMIEAYRLAAARMADEGMDYPLHLGVTEAGDGEDARVKSAIGIGALLYDGLGDTIRVSLTEDPVHELPVARDLADKAMRLWRRGEAPGDGEPAHDAVDPYDYHRRTSEPLEIGPGCSVGGEHAPAVIVAAAHPPAEFAAIIREVCETRTRLRETPIEGLQLALAQAGDLDAFVQLHEALHSVVRAFVLDLGAAIDLDHLARLDWPQGIAGTVLCQRLGGDDAHYAAQLLQFCRQRGFSFALDCAAADLPAIAAQLAPMGGGGLLLTDSATAGQGHPLGAYRALADAAATAGLDAPLWIRCRNATFLDPQDRFGDRLLESSMLAGALLCDGLGDLIGIEDEPLAARAATLAYKVLQGARARISKTEFVACPSCGRTLFDLQRVTRAIRSRTGHLKGVTIAIMGCIVNGPGEMADADFGYVGGAPGKVNLYVGRDCVRYHVPEDEALDRLIDLIREHGKWAEPEPVQGAGRKV